MVFNGFALIFIAFPLVLHRFSQIRKKDNFLNLSTLRSRAIERVPFLKSNYFHGFALSGGWENICNLHKSNSVEILSRNTLMIIFLHG